MNTKLLKQKILDLAIRGKLSQQLKSDGNTTDLLKEIADAKSTLSQPKGKKSKDLKQIIPLDKNEAPFEIPANWEWVRLGDVAKKITDGTHHSPVNLETGDFMYVTAKNIKDDGIHLENITYVSSDTHKEIFARCNPEKGDVLLIKDGATTGVVTVNNLEEPFSLLSSVALLKLGSSIESWYLAFVIRSTLFNQMIRSQMKGVGITRVTLKQIESFAFPLPPLAEQQRIVEKIQEAFAEIDSIENNKELLKTHIKQARQKMLDLAIHGKLVPQNKSDEPASVLLERITRDNPHYEKLINIPFEIPDSWEWVKLGDVCDDFIVPQRDKPTEFNGSIPWCRIEDIEGKYLNGSKSQQLVTKQLAEKMNMHLCPKGTVISACSASIGNQAITTVECYTNQTFIGIVCNCALFNEYLYYFLTSQNKTLKEMGKGTTIGYISRKKYEDFLLPLPPLAEQKRIVDKIEEIFASLDEISLHLV